MDGFLRGQCLSNKLSILLKKSWSDRFGFPEGIWRVLFQSMFSISFSKAFGSKLWNDLFSFTLCGWTPVSCPGTSRNWVRWSEIWGCYISWDDIAGGIIIEYIIYKGFWSGCYSCRGIDCGVEWVREESIYVIRSVFVCVAIKKVHIKISH